MSLEEMSAQADVWACMVDNTAFYFSAVGRSHRTQCKQPNAEIAVAADDRINIFKQQYYIIITLIESVYLTPGTSNSIAYEQSYRHRHHFDDGELARAGVTYFYIGTGTFYVD